MHKISHSVVNADQPREQKTNTTNYQKKNNTYKKHTPNEKKDQKDPRNEVQQQNKSHEKGQILNKQTNARLTNRPDPSFFPVIIIWRPKFFPFYFPAHDSAIYLSRPFSHAGGAKRPPFKFFIRNFPATRALYHAGRLYLLHVCVCPLNFVALFALAAKFAEFEICWGIGWKKWSSGRKNELVGRENRVDG